MLIKITEALLIACLFFAFLGDILQSVSRVSVSVLRLPDLATHLSTLSMLVNRFGAAIALLLIGYCIDTGIKPDKLVLAYFITIIIVGLFYALTALNGDNILLHTEKFVKFYYRVNPQWDSKKLTVKQAKTARFDLTLIYFITIAGFLLPSVLAAIYPVYRGSLLQSGFLLNSIATLYTALKIEKDIALSLISGDDNLKWHALVIFLISRAYACLAAAVGFGILYWIMQ